MKQNQYFDEFRKAEGDNVDQVNVSDAIEKKDDKVLCHIAKVIKISGWTTVDPEELLSSIKSIIHHFAEYPFIKYLNEMMLETKLLQLMEYAKKCHSLSKARPLDIGKIFYSSMKSSGPFDHIFLMPCMELLKIAHVR